MPAIDDYIEAGRETVPGWFHHADATMFRVVHEVQEAHGIKGDLLEIGAYLGRSAVLLGYLTRDGEALVVSDLFGGAAPSEEIERESGRFYQDLTLDEFRAHFARFHSWQPKTLIGPSDQTLPELPSGSFRFVHVDGSHSYEAVVKDIAEARRLLGPGGIVVFDDMLSPHTPGVQAAVWAEIAGGGLRPLAMLRRKLYASWDDSITAEALSDGIGRHPDSLTVADRHAVRDVPVLEVLPVRRPEPPAPPEPRTRQVARLLLPPAVPALGRRVKAWLEKRA